MDVNTVHKIDLLVLSGVMQCDDPVINLEFDLRDSGISEPDLNERLFAMSRDGYITIDCHVGQTLVTGITERGKVYFHGIGG